MEICLNASIVTMNPVRILDEVRILESLGIHSLHFDFMDGHRVPRYGLYPEILEALANKTEMIFDLHFMVSDLKFALSEIRSIERVDTISFHFTDDLEAALYNVDLIRSVGCRPLLCINLTTPLHLVERLVRFDEVDGYNFLAIHPGVKTQEKRIAQMIDAIPDFIDILTINSPRRDASDYVFQCDGGVTFESIPPLLETGINNLVLGTGAIYRSRDFTKDDLDKDVILRNSARINKVITDNV